MLLYDNPVSGNCYKVRLILGLLGIEFERRELSVSIIQTELGCSVV